MGRFTRERWTRRENKKSESDNILVLERAIANGRTKTDENLVFSKRAPGTQEPGLPHTCRASTSKNPTLVPFLHKQGFSKAFFEKRIQLFPTIIDEEIAS